MSYYACLLNSRTSSIYDRYLELSVLKRSRTSHTVSRIFISYLDISVTNRQIGKLQIKKTRQVPVLSLGSCKSFGNWETGDFLEGKTVGFQWKKKKKRKFPSPILYITARVIVMDCQTDEAATVLTSTTESPLKTFKWRKVEGAEWSDVYLCKEFS